MLICMCPTEDLNKKLWTLVDKPAHALWDDLTVPKLLHLHHEPFRHMHTKQPTLSRMQRACETYSGL